MQNGISIMEDSCIEAYLVEKQNTVKKQKTEKQNTSSLSVFF